MENLNEQIETLENKQEIAELLQNSFNEPNLREQMFGCMNAVRNIAEYTDDKTFFLIELRDFLLDFNSKM